MRGDSLRDFYAKTLAVLGLGLLAGAGALVDYWPVNEELPVAPAVTGLVASAPLPPATLTVEIPAPVIRVTPPRPVNFISTVGASALLETGMSVDIRFVALERAPLPENFIVVEAAQPAAMPEESLDSVSPPLPDTVTEESHRLLADAMRRTKEHMAAARLFLNDAMTGVVGAFRKVSPFFTTTAIVPGLDN